MKFTFAAICLITFCLNNESFRAQCTWSPFVSESFEYTTPIPGLIPAMVYQASPQTFVGCVRTGTRGMYMNIVNGQAGLLFSRTFSNLCLGKLYRFSFSTRDAFSSSNNLTFNIYDGNNILIQTQNVITNSIWQDITLPNLTANTTSFRFEIVTNLAGGPGNDVGFDDLVLSSCNLPLTSVSINDCEGIGSINLFNSISTSQLSTNGTWSGPSALSNNSLGTFTPGTNMNGTYVYSISSAANCPDSSATVQVNLIASPILNPITPLNACTSVTLPAILGTNLSGQQKYYTQPNGAGTPILPGSTITTSQQLYAYDGLPNCQDEEIINISISTPSNAGNDNAASYCGPGQILTLNSFLSANATAGGNWQQTSGSNQSSFNSATSIWNTSNTTAGTYSFSYTVPANGACPSDLATFTINIGSMANVNLGNDTTLCPGQTIWLNAGVYDNYLWNNGSTNSTKYVNTAGTYSVRVGLLGPNQVVNGNFEAGATGFTTAYTPGVGGPWGLLSNPGTYAVSSSPNLTHSNFVSCQDATAAPGVNMLIVNGASTPNTNVWCQTIPVQPNTNYVFGSSVASAVSGTNVGQLQFSINNSILGTVFSASTTAGIWTQFNQNWQSGINTTAQICIMNQNTSGGGNDFMLDEITFRPICYKYDTIVVTYGANPIVNLGPDQNVCEGTIINLNAGNTGSSYLWNTTATTQEISVTSTGNYSITVTSVDGCIGSDQISINYELQKNAGLDSIVQLCSTTDQVVLNDQLSALTTIGGFWASSNYSGSINSTGNIDITGLLGTYDFNYIVEGTFCPNDTSNHSLIIHEQPVAANPINLHFCNTLNSLENLSTYLNQPINPIGAYWTFSQNFISTSFNTLTNELQTGNLSHDNYQLFYILEANSPCLQDTFTINLQITQVPTVSFIPDVLTGCQPLLVNFENQSQAIGSLEYYWDFGNGETSTQAAGNSIIYPNAVCHDVSLTITADGLCTSTLIVPSQICVNPLPIAEFSYGPHNAYSFDPTITFENNSVNNDFNQWYFGDGQESSNINPTHTYPIGDVGNYLVELFVETIHGCVDSATAIVVVRDELLYYVPNTFTPDSDEFNQIFLPILSAGFDQFDYKLEIYNRWGEIIFESNDINSGWDGTYHGLKSQTGTYTYKIEVGLFDSDERMQINGSVNLLK
jgi:gliding motility-associated-like protein